MLRLKQAMNDCNIPQKLLCEATGFGKTQISLTLSTGKLPADIGKFRSGVALLLDESESLKEWLGIHNLVLAQLFDDISELVPGRRTASNQQGSDLERLLCEIAGRAVINGQNITLVHLASAASRLLKCLRDLAGHDAPYMLRLETEIAAIVTGETEASHG